MLTFDVIGLQIYNDPFATGLYIHLNHYVSDNMIIMLIIRVLTLNRPGFSESGKACVTSLFEGQ